MTESNALDPAALDRLRDWGGDDLLRQMVTLFLENAETRMEQIRTGVRDSDPAESEKGSHSLKSSAANVGAEHVRTLAAEIEGAATRGDADAVAKLLPDLETAYAEARQALEAVMGGLT